MKRPLLCWIHQRLFPLLAMIWVALILPDLGTRYSFGWDSSQFDRAVSDFDIARHQPHPPGYPLWVLALRALSPILNNPNRAQILLAVLFTLAGLAFFRAVARPVGRSRRLVGHPASGFLAAHLPERQFLAGVCGGPLPLLFRRLVYARTLVGQDATGRLRASPS